MSWKTIGLLVVILAARNTWSKAIATPDLDAYATDDISPHLTVGLTTTFTYHGTGVGAAGFFYWPILPRGFVSDPVRDAVVAGGGLHFCYWNWREEQKEIMLMLFAPTVGLRYLVYTFDTVALTMDVRLGPAFSLTENYHQGTKFFWYTGGGILWDLSDFLALNAEFGWGSSRDSLRLGLVFWF